MAKSHSSATAISDITFYKDTSAVRLLILPDTIQPCLDIEHDSSQSVRQGGIAPRGRGRTSAHGSFVFFYHEPGSQEQN